MKTALALIVGLAVSAHALSTLFHQVLAPLFTALGG
jgi:hypothetical protein